MVKRWVNPSPFQPNGGVGKTRPREVPTRASTCLELNSDARARRPQPMQSTHTSFFGHAFRADGPVALPIQLQFGGMPPQFQ